MHDLAPLLPIAGALTLSVMSPGPNVALVTTTAAGGSRRAGVMTALGLAAASLTWTALALTSVGVVLARGGWVHSAVRTAGALYLVWLGLRTIAGARRPVAAAALTGGATGLAAVARGYLVSMTNPAALAFYGSVFAVMVPAQAPRWFFLAVPLIAVTVSASWYCSLAWAFSAPVVRGGFQRSRAAIETVTGGFFLVVGGRMLSGR